MFHNIKSGERRLCTTEPMIAAHLNTSDRNPNAMQGQDMGWRLSPKTVLKIEEIAGNPMKLQEIATAFGIPTDDLVESDILNWVSRQSDKDNTGQTTDKKDYEREYQADINRLRDEQRKRDDLIVKEAAKTGAAVPQRILDGQNQDENLDTEVTDNGNIVPSEGAPTDISKMKRPQLNEYAETVGIDDPAGYPNVPKLMEAIKLKEAEEA